MRFPTTLLIALLAITACVPLTRSAGRSADITFPSWTPALDGTLMTSLLVSEWRGDSEGAVLFPLDPVSGTSLPEYSPIPLGHTYFYAFSRARKSLAVVSFTQNDAYKGKLFLIDLAHWRTHDFKLELKGWVNRMVFNPNGKLLAIAHGETRHYLTVVDMEQGIIRAQKRIDPFVTRLKFTADGTALMLYGTRTSSTDGLSAGPPEVQLLDTQDLSLRWSTELKNVHDGIFPKDNSVASQDLYEPGKAIYISPGLAFAPNRDALYVVHADTEQLTTVDFAAREVSTAEIRPRLGMFERLLALTAGVVHAKVGDMTSRQAAISPDGKLLYVIGTSDSSFQDEQGNWQREQTALGLEIIQTSDGASLKHSETDATELSLSPDGRFLYLRNWGDNRENSPWTQIVDTSTLQSITRQPGSFATPALLMNGEFLLVSTYTTSETSYRMSVLRPDGKRVLADWTSPQSLWWLTAP